MIKVILLAVVLFSCSTSISYIDSDVVRRRKIVDVQTKRMQKKMMKARRRGARYERRR